MKGSSRRTFLELAAAAALLAGCAPAKPRSAAAKATVKRARERKKILILGGTGFLGPQLVEYAKERGHTLTLFNRGKTNSHLFPELEKLQGDRKTGDLKALEGRRWDAVIDTSGYVPKVVKQSADLLGPNVSHYVFISTISVYSDTATPGLDENGPLMTIADETNENVQENYGALKALCEKAAETSMPGRVTNIRPGLIVGPGNPTDRYTYWPVRVARGGEILAPGDGKDPVQYIDVRDLAAWTITLVEGRTMGVFNAMGPEKPHPMAELISACMAASPETVAKTTFHWVPASFLEKQDVAPWSDLPVWVPSGGDSAGFGRMSNARAIATGLTFRPAAETAKDTLAWFRTLPEERKSSLRAGLTPEREAKVLAAWKKERGA